MTLGTTVLLALALVLPDQPITEEHVAPLAALSFSCDNCAAGVSVGGTLQWRVTAQVGYVPEDLGLAGFCVDLIQTFGNPAAINMTSGNRPATGTDLAKFDRPLGIANPAPPGSGLGSGFGGTPLPAANSAVGGLDLIQIGGGQNTFGTTGTNIGQTTTVVSGVALGQAVTVATGSFIVPSVEGAYQIELSRGMVTVLLTVGGAAVPSQVRGAITDLGAPLMFNVVGCPADFNHDGFVNPDDLSDFITCFFLQIDFGTCPEADINGDGFVNPDDLSDFITIFFLGC